MRMGLIVLAAVVVGLAALGGALYVRGGAPLTVDVTTPLEAPPARVFRWLTDPELVVRWLGGLVDSQPLGDGLLGVGARSREVVEENGRRMEMITTVTRLEPGRVLGVHLVTDGFESDALYELAPQDGGTVLSYHSTVRMKGAMRLVAPTLAGAIRDKMEGDLRTLAEALRDEAAAGDGGEAGGAADPAAP